MYLQNYFGSSRQLRDATYQWILSYWAWKQCSHHSSTVTSWAMIRFVTQLFVIDNYRRSRLHTWRRWQGRKKQSDRKFFYINGFHIYPYIHTWYQQSTHTHTHSIKTYTCGVLLNKRKRTISLRQVIKFLTNRRKTSQLYYLKHQP